MAGEDDDIVVTIEGETETHDGGNTTVVLEETHQPVRKQAPDDPIETLKAQLAERNQELVTANQRATAAETTAQQATQRVQTAERVATEARAQVAQSTRATIESGIAAAKAEADAAEDAYKVAHEAGDAGAMAKAQRRMARAEADLSQLESAKADLPAVEKRPQQQPTPPVDQTEAFISQHTPRTQSWMRAHMDYVTDAKKNAKMVAGHWSAVSEGIAPDTDQYFEHVERFVGLKPNGKAAEPKPEPQREANGQYTSQRRPSAPVAPVTPTGGGVEGGKRSITLTPGEARAAQDGTIVWNYPDPSGKNRWQKGDPIGLTEMAKRKEALAKEGRYHNGSVDGT